MNIIIGNDHGALDLKNEIVEKLKIDGHDITNIGVDSPDSVDYPDIAEKTCRKYLEGGYDFGILMCGTGIGISISANKIKGIRCAMPHNIYAARMAKEHNNANFLSFGGRIEYGESVYDMIKSFILSTFSGDRHERRVNKIMNLENE